MSMFYELMMKKKGMPSRYQEVEYIESTGTQYIDTGIKNNDNNTIETKFILEANGSPTICGGKTTEAGYFFYSNSVSAMSTNSLRILKSTGKVEISSITTGVKHSLKITLDNVVYDNNILDWQSDTGNSAKSNICLFVSRYSANDKYGIIKICGFSIRNSDNSLVRNFIPVYDTLTNKYGMWESVQGKFYGNDGTGNFTGA